MKYTFLKAKEVISIFVCDLLHSGGRIKRDDLGRINWQCDTCMRWSSKPVPIRDETLQVNMQISKHIDSMTSRG